MKLLYPDWLQVLHTCIWLDESQTLKRICKCHQSVRSPKFYNLDKDKQGTPAKLLSCEKGLAIQLLNNDIFLPNCNIFCLKQLYETVPSSSFLNQAISCSYLDTFQKYFPWSSVQSGMLFWPLLAAHCRVLPSLELAWWPHSAFNCWRYRDGLLLNI